MFILCSSKNNHRNPDKVVYLRVEHESNGTPQTRSQRSVKRTRDTIEKRVAQRAQILFIISFSKKNQTDVHEQRSHYKSPRNRLGSQKHVGYRYNNDQKSNFFFFFSL